MNRYMTFSSQVFLSCGFLPAPMIPLTSACMTALRMNVVPAFARIAFPPFSLTLTTASASTFAVRVGSDMKLVSAFIQTFVLRMFWLLTRTLS